MKKLYKTNWLSSLYRSVFAAAAILLAGGMASAQLSGTYTIDPSGSGTKNYTSFSAFASALSSNGISANVIVNVASGTYSESVVFNAYNGASSSSTVTINGNGATITTTSSKAVIELYQADYITFNNLKVNAAGTSNNTKCVLFRSNADHNTFDKCEFIVSKYTGTSNSTAYVAFSNSRTSTRSSGNHGSHNTIKNGKWWNGSTTSKSQGPYYGVVEYYNNATGNNKFENNDIQSVYYYWFYNYYSNGYKIIGNDMHDARSNARYAYITYAYYGNRNGASEQIQINDNKVHNIDVSYMYGMYSYRCEGTTAKPFQMNGNLVYNCSGDYYVYGPRPYYANNCEANDNKVYNNNAGYYVYGIYGYYASNLEMSRNSIYNNSADYGVYGYYHYYATGTINNNEYMNNKGGYYNYAFLGGYTRGSLDVCHNTIVLNNNVDYYSYAFYAYMYYSFTKMNYKNNIVVISGRAGYYNYPVYSAYNYDKMGWENNDFYVTSPSTNYWYTNGQNTTLAAFNSSVNTSSNISVDPKFKNLAANDVTPTNPAIANYGLPGYEDVDINMTKRTACGPDIGAHEFTVDHNASNLVFTGTKECGGYMEAIKFTYNNGANIDLEDARVYYTINKGTAAEIHVEETIDSVKANSSADYTFEAIPTFNEPGTNTIEVGLACDDNASNNVLTTSIDITPAPHSFETAEGTNFPAYYNSGTLNNPDVTVPGKEIEYTVENPAKYDNANYSSDWTAALAVWTTGGMDASSSASLVNPSSGTKGILKFNPADSLADSTVWVGLTVTDLSTGCDSTFGRWVYVPHTPDVDFEYKDGCDGDVVAFTNKTTQEIGVTEYSWTFGDPASGTENNMSTISDPVHRFSTYGSYDVTMTAWNFDYPLFTYEITKTINISPVPTVDYRVHNACQGEKVEFENFTSLPSGITGTIDYSWDFGDGSAKVTTKDASYDYGPAGGYKVTLTASLRGCAASLTKNANQFAKPVADFSVAGTCNLEDIEFTNGSTIAIGNTGYAWDFNDGSVSNLTNPKHAFAAPGSHTVKLRAISEFGCLDSTERTFTLNESPKADFDFTDPCSETAVEFTRTGSLPSGANSIFEWDFDGEMTSTKENDNYKFSTVGVKNVSLKVSSDNGCSDMISKEFVVKLQARADFIANDVCEGDDVVFTNKSEVAAGNLDYEWRFGGQDANGMSTSSLTSPRHNYVLNEGGVTESFRVTLLAIVPGGCSDSIAKTVTVNAAPDAGFSVARSGREITCTPDENDNSNMYNWRFGDGGRSTDIIPTYRYSADEETFTVCLAIQNNAGCWSEECEEVTISTLGVENAQAEDIFSVYPNPTSGMFNVNLTEAMDIVIMDATGKTIETVSASGSGVYTIDLSDRAAGVYMVQVTNGNISAMQRVTVAK